MADNGKRKADDLLIALLASGRTARESAALCNLSERTIGRRLADSVFSAKVAAARSLLAADAQGKLASLLTEAADTMQSLLKSPLDGVRLGAARSVVDAFAKLTDLVDHSRRLAELAERLDQLELEDNKGG